MRLVRAAVLALVVGTTAVGTPARAEVTATAPISGISSTSSAAVTRALADAINAGGSQVLGSVRVAGQAAVDTCATATASSRDALLRSLAERDGCHGFATTSLDPVAGDATNAGLLHVPYAVDAVTYAVSGTSSVPRELTKRELGRIYSCAVNGYSPLLPRAGSELRTRWLRYLGITETALAAGKHPCVADRANGAHIEENDGRVLASNSVVPFSVASYVAQQAAVVPDVSADTALGAVAEPDVDGRGPVLPNEAAYPSDVTFALADSSEVSAHLRLSELRAIYTCQVRGITPLLPATGSTRAAWLTRLGISDSAVRQGAYPCIQTAAGGTAIAENDARALTVRSIVPFSPSEYADQRAGLTPDVRAGSTLGVISAAGQRPSLPLMLNSGYVPELVHRVYAVLPASAATADPVKQVFLGEGSLICSQGSLLRSHGYVTLDPDSASTCGSIVTSTSGPGGEPSSPQTPNQPDPGEKPEVPTPEVPKPEVPKPEVPNPEVPNSPGPNTPPRTTGYPDASTTGAKGTLVDLGGSLDVTDEDAIIDGVYHKLPASGSLSPRPGVVLEPGIVKLDGVKLTRLRNRSTRIRIVGDRVSVIAPVGADDAVTTVDGTQSSGTAFIHLTNCTVWGSTGNIAVAWRNFRLDRCDISGGLDAVRLGSNTHVTNSYLHDLERVSGSHNDIFQIIAGSNVTVTGNTALAYRDSTRDPMNAVLQIGDLTGNISNVVFEDNYCNGGNFTFNANWLSVDAGANKVSNFRIANNVLERKFRYGPKASMSHGIVWSGNTWADNGGAV